MQVRWRDTVASLNSALVTAAGDAAVAAGAIAYAGPFTPAFRADLTAQWRAALAELGVPVSAGASLIKTLENPAQARAWQLAGLPADTQSLENGVRCTACHLSAQLAYTSTCCSLMFAAIAPNMDTVSEM